MPGVLAPLSRSSRPIRIHFRREVRGGGGGGRQVTGTREDKRGRRGGGERRGEEEVVGTRTNGALILFR